MKNYHYFVAYDFNMKDKENFVNAIKTAFGGTQLNGYYADLEIQANGQHILKKIEDMIIGTNFGIYDLSTGNLNVYLELGIARGAKKRFYIILKKGTPIPADLQGIDRIEYDNYKSLTEEIKNKIAHVEMKQFISMREISKYEYDDILEDKILKGNGKIYQAEDLMHRFGWKLEDESASNGKAWFVNMIEYKGHIIYGPYDKLQETGNYIVYFKMKIDDNSSISPILLLDVSGGAYSSRIVRGINFNKSNEYQLFGVQFECIKLQPMEFRVFNQVQYELKLWIDYIAVFKYPMN